jgi:hypothetical protein
MPRGFEEEQTARVVGNGEGGTKRAWNPATRCSPKVSGVSCWRKVAPGSRLLELRTLKGRINPREEVQHKVSVVADWPGVAEDEAKVLLEGERKAMSGIQVGRINRLVARSEDVRVRI